METWGILVWAELALLHMLLLVYGASVLVFISPIESAWKKPVAHFVASSRLARRLARLDGSFSALYAATAARGIVGLVCCGGGCGGGGGLWWWVCGGGDALLCACRLYVGAGNWVGVKLSSQFQFLLSGSADDILAAEQAAARRAMLAWRPPPLKLFDALLAPYAFVLRPEVQGLEALKARLGTRPALFVMNHSLGGIEMPITIKVLYSQAGIYVRGLADHIHWSVPVWGPTLRMLGGVDGTRANCSALMEAGQSLLVYPGGAHEVFKGKADEKYGLQWKERLGFARLAIKHGYPIVPCCCVGSEDMLEISRDLPLGFLRDGLTLPLIKPPHPKKLQKLYFYFGTPILTAKFCGGDGGADTAAATAVRDATRDAVNEGISLMRARQVRSSAPRTHVAHPPAPIVASLLTPPCFFLQQAEDPERHTMQVAAKNIQAKTETLRNELTALLGGGGGTSGKAEVKTKTSKCSAEKEKEKAK